MWSSIPAIGPPFRYSFKNWTNSHRNPGPDPTGIADQFPPESLDQLHRNPHRDLVRVRDRPRVRLARLRPGPLHHHLLRKSIVDHPAIDLVPLLLHGPRPGDWRQHDVVPLGQ